MKAKAYSTLQKTYDQTHLTCSIAVYYESQGNEVEALRCWRECFAQLQCYRAEGYRPHTETEKTLLQSLKTMQNQCQDKVEILQAVLASRIDSRENGQRTNSNDGQRMAGFNSLKSPLTGAPIDSTMPPPALPERSPTLSDPIGISTRPQLAQTFQPTSKASHGSASQLRIPNPEKRAFLSTLRPTKKGKKSEPSPKIEGTTAVKAATLAWSSISRAEGAALSRALLVPLVDYRPVKQNYGTSASAPDLLKRQQSSPPRMMLDQPDLLNTKHHLHSTIIPPAAPTQTSLEAGPPPPPPPPHKQPLGASYATSSKSRVTIRNEQPSEPHIELRLDPLAVPIALPQLTHLNLSINRKPVPTRRILLEQENSRQKNIQVSTDNLNLGSHRDGDQGNNAEIASGSKEITYKDNPNIEDNDRVAKALKNISKGVDMQAAIQVAKEIVVRGDDVKWDDVAGLDAAKMALKEAVVYPFLRPDLFSGLREPARGMLLFGPPGTGKTMLARAVATESKSTFFSISASSLTSKYLGESEKLVRALFALAKALAPSIIFVDEIDSLLSSRNSTGEHEATRRIKTEFLIQWSDLARAAAGEESDTGDASRVLVLAATNLPWAIDDAARRRFVRRQYIPLPEGSTRQKQLLRLLSHQKYQLSAVEMERLIKLTDGFSGSDITALAKDAAMGPLRSLGEALLYMKKEDIRPITFLDFEASLYSIRPSVSKEGLQAFEDWAKEYGERV